MPVMERSARARGETFHNFTSRVPFVYGVQRFGLGRPILGLGRRGLLGEEPGPMGGQGAIG